MFRTARPADIRIGTVPPWNARINEPCPDFRRGLTYRSFREIIFKTSRIRKEFRVQAFKSGLPQGRPNREIEMIRRTFRTRPRCRECFTYSLNQSQGRHVPQTVYMQACLWCSTTGLG